MFISQWISLFFYSSIWSFGSQSPFLAHFLASSLLWCNCLAYCFCCVFENWFIAFDGFENIGDGVDRIIYVAKVLNSWNFGKFFKGHDYVAKYVNGELCLIVFFFNYSFVFFHFYFQFSFSSIIFQCLKVLFFFIFTCVWVC